MRKRSAHGTIEEIEDGMYNEQVWMGMNENT
jgi:hypothetical protein